MTGYGSSFDERDCILSVIMIVPFPLFFLSLLVSISLSLSRSLIRVPRVTGACYFRAGATAILPTCYLSSRKLCRTRNGESTNRGVVTNTSRIIGRCNGLQVRENVTAARASGRANGRRIRRLCKIESLSPAFSGCLARIRWK